MFGAFGASEGYDVDKEDDEREADDIDIDVEYKL